MCHTGLLHRAETPTGSFRVSRSQPRRAMPVEQAFDDNTLQRTALYVSSWYNADRAPVERTTVGIWTCTGRGRAPLAWWGADITFVMLLRVSELDLRRKMK